MFRLSLRDKLLLGVLLILVPMLGLLLYGFQSQHSRQREDVLANQTRLGQTIAVLADSSFDEALALAETLADDPVVQTLDPSTLDPYFKRLIRYRPDLEDIAVVDATGTSMGSAAVRPGPRPSAVGRRYFDQVMATGAPALSEVIISRVTSRPTVVAAAPVPGPDGRPAGVTIVALYLDGFARSLESVGLRPGQAIFLADQTGRLAFHTAGAALSWEERDYSSVPEVQAVLAGRTVLTASFRAPLPGDLRAGAFVPTPRHGWVVGVTWPVSAAFGPVERAFRLQLLLFGAVAVVSALATVLMARYLTAPLLKLTFLAEAFGRGELGRRADVRTGDELQRLAETFNAMAARLQETLRDREEALRIREEFIAAAAHELRTPTTSLKGHVGMLRRLPETRSGRIARALASIDVSAARVAHLASDLVEFADLDRGTLPLRPGRFDLAQIARRVVDRAAVELPDYRFRLETAPAMVVGDEKRIGQVVRYLLDNAVKYQPLGGDIEVSVAVEGDQALLSVRDHGPGIPPERQPFVFEPMYEPLPPGADGYIGVVGLGLAISKRLIEAQGGMIWVESAPSRGSTFRFGLPLAEARLV